MPLNDSFFKLTRLRFSELYTDALNFLKQSYKNFGQYFSVASPLGQLLQVVLNLGRMIIYYIEDSITELNILTATRPQSVKGLAVLTGHNPSRAIAARGTLKLTFSGNANVTNTPNTTSNVNTIIIPNYTQLTCNLNNLSYTIILPTEELRMNLANMNSSVEVNVMQGVIEYQQATGNGTPLQSFNFQSKQGSGIDNYFVNVYVNGEQWRTVESILDMTFLEKACMVKTGQSGGIDIFFGNGYNGMIPEASSTILVEYLVTSGDQGNLDTLDVNLENVWKFSTPGYLTDGSNIDLNKYLNVSVQNNILFGTIDEPLYLTRLLAPHTSRSFVLANDINYLYFLKKLNKFSIIDAFKGFNTFEDKYNTDKLNQYSTEVSILTNQYQQNLRTLGEDNPITQASKAELDNAISMKNFYESEVKKQKMDDNVIYLFLIPDISQRIGNGFNYFTAPLDVFKLSDYEKEAIYDLIEESGQRVITMDDHILDPIQTKFVVNMSLILWEGYNKDNIYENIITSLSDYFISNTRRDRIPVSDLIKIVENIDGVDSVNIWFEPDKENINVYKINYGIDEFGDIILTRDVQDANGNIQAVGDIQPLIRGGFESLNGIYYNDVLYQQINDNYEQNQKYGNVNIYVRGYTKQTTNSLLNKQNISNIISR